MKEKTVKIFAMRCSEDRVFKGHIEDKENTLEASKLFVGGYIQVVSLTEDIDIVINDEGKLDGLPVNRVWCNSDGKAFDILVGNIFACRHDEEGNFTSILEDDIPVILKRLPAFEGTHDKTLYCRREENLPEYGENKKH